MYKEALILAGRLHELGFYKAEQAIYKAEDMHRGHVRDDKKTGYAEHPIRVARTLLLMGIRDDITLAAALLHDGVEEGVLSQEETLKNYGEEVAHLVKLLTRTDNMTKPEHIENVSRDIRTILIKAFDRLCNVDDMTQVYDEKRLARYIRETEQLILPMMKEARRKYFEHTDKLLICRDYIKGILKSARKIVELYEKERKLKDKIKILRKKSQNMTK